MEIKTSKNVKGEIKLTEIVHQELDPDPFFPNADPRIRIRFLPMRVRGSGSFFFRCGSTDPDPHKNDTDPQQWD